MSEQLNQLPVSRFMPVLCLVLFVTGCDRRESGESELKAPEMPVFEEPDLVKGKIDKPWPGNAMVVRNFSVLGIGGGQYGKEFLRMVQSKPGALPCAG